MKIFYNILDFGATPSKSELQSPFIQKAIDECAKNGGGEVIIPTGTYLIGSLYIRSNVTLHLMENAILLGSRNPNDYSDFEIMQTNAYECILAQALPLDRELRKNRALVSARFEKNFKIIGENGAKFDGQNCFDELGEENLRGPRGMLFFDCENIELGNFTLANCANHACAIGHSKNVYAHKVDFEGGHDGFGFGFSSNVLVEDCKIVCGDDCFAFAFAENVVIKNCELNTSCNLFRMGGSDVLLDNCHCQGPAVYGHRMTLSHEELVAGASSKGKGRNNVCSAFLYFSYVPRSPEFVKPHKNMTMQNCTFDNLDCLFMFHYDENLHQTYENLESATIKNCVATNVCIPIIVRSAKENATEFVMENVHLSAKKGFEDKPFMITENCKSLVLRNVTLENYTENVMESLNGRPNLQVCGCDDFSIREG